MRVNPGALMVGTDLPSTRARRTFQPEDLELTARAAAEAGGEELADDVFWSNAARWYLGL